MSGGPFRESARPTSKRQEKPPRWWLAVLAVGATAVVAQMDAWLPVTTVVVAIPLIGAVLVTLHCGICCVDKHAGERFPRRAVLGAAAAGVACLSLILAFYAPEYLRFVPAWAVVWGAAAYGVGAAA